MKNQARSLQFVRLSIAVCLLHVGSRATAQLTSGTDVNTPRKGGSDTECAISKNPANPLQLFASCNTASAGLFAARSTDGGATWVFPDPADRTIADGDAGQGPAACCDPTTAWDSFGNLYLTYLANGASAVVTLLSTDGGATFTTLASFGGSVDQPTIVAANTTAAGAPVAVWIVWNQSGQMVARGAAVTALGTVGAFGALQTIPGSANCSFGDIAIAPNGAVVQACQSPTGGQGPGTIRVNTDPDGLGAGNFGASVAATTTNVGGFDFIPAQNSRSVDSEAGLAFDNNPTSPRFGRLYLVYTEETAAENHDLDVMLRFSDNNGATWSAPTRVNDDPAAPIRSQFLPKIAVDDTSGNVLVCWHDCRNSGTNVAMQEFCAIAAPTGATPTFSANAQVSDGASVSNNDGMDFGDYSGLDYFSGVAHPIWGDTSNSTANNPDATANFDAYTDRVSGPGAATVAQIQVPGSPDFGMACTGSRNRGTLKVCNTGKADLTVPPITSSNPQFSVSTPSSGFPVVISPDFCFPFEVVFQPSGTGAQSATLTITSNDPTHGTTTVQVTGSGSQPDVRATGSTAYGVASAWPPAETAVSLCNTGGCPLSVASASVSCSDFALTDNPFPATVSPGSCLGLGIEFTPTVPGPRSCTLSVNSNDPDTPTITRSLTARTPPFLTLHAGLVDPHGSLASTTDTGGTFTLGFVNPFAARWAWDLRVGGSSLDGVGGPDIDVWSALANVKFTLNPAAPLRVFVNGGLGIYVFDPGDVEGGFNLGVGLNIPAGRRFAFEGTYNYHNAVTASPDLRFSQFQIGLLISF